MNKRCQGELPRVRRHRQHIIKTQILMCLGIITQVSLDSHSSQTPSPICSETYHSERQLLLQLGYVRVLTDFP